MFNNQDITLHDILAARQALKGYIFETPTIESHSLEFKTDHDHVILKCENLQRAGSYHIRGMLNKVIKTKEKDLSINNFVVASTGNTGAALALAAQYFQAQAHVVLPSTIKEIIPRSIKHYKGCVYVCPPTLEARDKVINEILETYQNKKMTVRHKNEFQKAVLVRPYDDRHVITGYATLGVEFMMQTKQALDCLIVPVCGGALLAGVALGAKKIKPNLVVIAAELEPKYQNLNILMNNNNDSVAKDIKEGQAAAAAAEAAEAAEEAADKNKNTTITSPDASANKAAAEKSKKNIIDDLFNPDYFLFKHAGQTQSEAAAAAAKTKGSQDETDEKKKKEIKADNNNNNNNSDRPLVSDTLSTPISGSTKAIIDQTVHGVVKINEHQLQYAFRYVYERCKLVVDIHAATAVAALLFGSKHLQDYDEVGVLLSGGNVDLNDVPRLAAAKL